MTKTDGFDLILKAAGVYLCVLAIIALPNAIEGLTMFVLFLCNGADFLTKDAAGKLASTIQIKSLATCAGEIIRIILYLLIARNFLTGGSWIRKIMNKKEIAEPASAGDAVNRAPEK